MAPSNTAEMLQQAVRLHQAGAIADARNRYAELLRREPKNPEIHYLCGLASCQMGDIDTAIPHLQKAAALSPGRADAHHTLSMALQQCGRIADALASSERACACDPAFAEAHAHRATILQDLRRSDDALAAYDQALKLAPTFVPALINRGSLLQELGRTREALTDFDRALAIDSTVPEAWLNRSKALHALGAQDQALISCDRAIAQQPDFAPAHLARAVLLAERAQFERALAAIDEALKHQPGWTAAALERAAIFQKAGDLAGALQACETLLKSSPDWADAWHLHSRLLHDLSRIDDALVSIDEAIKRNPDRADAHAMRGAMLIKLNRPADALAALDRAIANDPKRGTFHVDRGLALQALGRFDDAAAALHRGCDLIGDGDAHVQMLVALNDLLHGRWIEGFRRYERRLELPHFNVLHRRFIAEGSDIDKRFTTVPTPSVLPDLPLWTGEPTGGEPILIETEQGIGDALQFARFAAQLAAQGHRIHLLTLPTLAPLLRTLPGIDAVIGDRDGLRDLRPKHWLPLMSVPHRLKTEPESIPFAVPYLFADPARAAQWATRLGPEGFRIGIAWQGNAQNWLDAGRSVPLAAFAPLAAIPGVRLISLQKRPGAEQIDGSGFGDRVERVLDETDKGAAALLDTAAVMTSLDLVVTSDSMIAHLAGALGVQTFIALRRVPDWRWLLDRDDSPFYPTVRLFRQSTEGDWTPVFHRIATAIRSLVAAR